MGRASRTKGQRGEREVVHILSKRGLTAQRTAPLQGSRTALAALTGTFAADVTVQEWPNDHLEVKFDETKSVDAMVRQAERDCKDKNPVVVYRRSRQPWRIVVTFDHYLGLRGAR